MVAQQSKVYFLGDSHSRGVVPQFHRWFKNLGCMYPLGGEADDRSRNPMTVKFSFMSTRP